MSGLSLFYKGSPILSGGFVSAGVPIGTIIPFMGKNSPDGYLICDGKEYDIKSYPYLAEFFKKEFDSYNYFGGDGINTFAVPDMRNLFLRGYHGESNEQLSGNIGKKQEGTILPQTYLDTKLGYIGSYNEFLFYANRDLIPNVNKQILKNTGPVAITSNEEVQEYPYFKVRPDNMSVLFCIKYTLDITEFSLDEYDNDEWHVMKYSNGYIEMSWHRSYNIQNFVSVNSTVGRLSYYAFFENNSRPAYPVPLIEIYSNDAKISSEVNINGATIVVDGWADSLNYMPRLVLNTLTYEGTKGNYTLWFKITGRWK